ncbi:MAG: hypothetical protein AAF654_12175 [Myxococcota bacterium]
MKPSTSAMFWLVLAIVGWLLAQAGFPPVEGDPAIEIGESFRRPLRLLGAGVLCIGVIGAGLAGLRGPLALFTAGVVLNIAAEAEVVAPHHLGLTGVLAAFVGCLWASRQFRKADRAQE